MGVRQWGVRQWGVRQWGVAGLGMLALACGGGRQTSPVAGTTGPTTGTEWVTITRVDPAPRGAEIVEVDESRLPTSAPRIDVASASGPEEPTQEEAAPDVIGPPAAREPVADASPPSTGTEPAPPPPALEVAAREICPADLASLRVRARNIPDGAAIVLTARGDDVARVRDRMREFARAHAAEHTLQQCADPSHATVTLPSPTSASWSHGFADPSSPLLSVHELRLVEIPDGVRVELRYGDGVERASVWELRAQVRDDVAALDDGICPLSFQTG